MTETCSWCHQVLPSSPSRSGHSLGSDQRCSTRHRQLPACSYWGLHCENILILSSFNFCPFSVSFTYFCVSLRLPASGFSSRPWQSTQLWRTDMRDFDSYGPNLCDCSWQSDVITKKLNYSSPKGDSRMPEESTQPKREKFGEEDKGRCFMYFPLSHVWTKWGLAAAEMQPLVISCAP